MNFRIKKDLHLKYIFLIILGVVLASIHLFIDASYYILYDLILVSTPVILSWKTNQQCLRIISFSIAYLLIILMGTYNLLEYYNLINLDIAYCYEYLVLINIIVLLSLCKLLNTNIIELLKNQDKLIDQRIEKYDSMYCTVPDMFDGSNIPVSYIQVFERLEEYFQKTHAYLNHQINIVDVAHAVYSNKSYVSRSIMYCKSMNFCQYVNEFRVKYSKELFLRNTDLSIGELANRSGFNSVVSYTTAFKFFEGTLPSSWCRERKSKISKIDSE